MLFHNNKRFPVRRGLLLRPAGHGNPCRGPAAPVPPQGCPGSSWPSCRCCCQSDPAESVPGSGVTPGERTRSGSEPAPPDPGDVFAFPRCEPCQGRETVLCWMAGLDLLREKRRGEPLSSVPFVSSPAPEMAAKLGTVCSRPSRKHHNSAA